MDLVYINICGPFLTASWNGHKYFITFTDNYSRFWYLYLLHEKSHSLDMFKTYKAEVENQLNRRIKTVRSDHCGEYYDRHDGSSRCPESFVNFLKSVALSFSTLCRGHLIKMVSLKEEIAH